MQVITESQNVSPVHANPPEFREEIREHHARLRMLMLGIGEILEARAARREEPFLTSALVALLTDLQHELPIHFDFEERGGYFTDVLRVAPEMSQHLEKLKQDHVAFIERSRKLLDCAMDAQKGTRRWDEVEQLFRKLSDRLLNHERNENDIIQQLFMLDTGSPG